MFGMLRCTALVLTLSLVGCSFGSTIPSGQHLPTGKSASNGGAFTATYSGSETNGSTCFLNRTFRFSGTGSASFLHQSEESGSMVWEFDPFCNLTGRATLVSASHPLNSVSVTLQAGAAACGGFLHKTTFTVHGGTGRFRHATGGGTIQFNCTSNGSYTDKWSGTLNF